jgi:N-acetylmuramoyl-L-alanine amidase CwlA
MITVPKPLTPDSVSKLNTVTVKEYNILEHNPNDIAMPVAMGSAPIGVTIHNTDVISVSGTTMSEQYTRATLNGNMGTVRVHFYVDGTEAWQNLPLHWQSWHCGQKGKSDNAKSVQGNAQTISIECIMGSVNDIAAEDNCAKLAAYILNKFGLGIENLYTHNYWCNVRNGKIGSVDDLNQLNDGYKGCPIYIRPHWYQFKTTVQNYMRQYKKPTQAEAVDDNYQYIVVQQYGAYSQKSNAEELLKTLRRKDPESYYKILKVKR